MSDIGARAIIFFIMFVLTLATLIYGVISWWIMKKFRNYRNYVFLNAISSYFLRYLIYLLKWQFMTTEDMWDEILISQTQTFSLLICLLDYLSIVKNHWLVVISHMFYEDIVKVFNGHIRRRYLKSSLFCWGVPLITYPIIWLIMQYFDYSDSDRLFSMYSLFVAIFFIILHAYFLPVIVNCFIYIIIVISLCRTFNTSAQTGTNNCRRLYISTLIFLLSDIILLSDYLMHILFLDPGHIAKVLLHNLNPLILVVFLLLVKSNRKTWYEFYINKLNQRLARQRDQDIVMHDGVICEPTEL